MTNLIKSTDYNIATATIYAQRDNQDTGFIAYRDLPKIFKNMYKTNENKALDFGCGSGFSSFLLYEAGYDVIGVDHNENMLKYAKISYPHITFNKITHSKPNFMPKYFDLILCAFVLLEFNSLEAIEKVLTELYRIIKTDGKLIIVTTSEYFPKNNWLTAKNDIVKNQYLKPGQNYKVLDTKNQMTFSDFYYDNESYKKVLMKTNFRVNNLYQPLGKKTDDIEWDIEWNLPPYSIYICSPIA